MSGAKRLQRNKRRAAASDVPWTGQYYTSEPCWRSSSEVETEVCAAVETLYLDELKPYGRILRKRLSEHAQVFPMRIGEIDVQQLQAVCESCPWLYVSREDGGDWSALLYGQPQTFVDVYSPEDVYPAEMWEAADTYFGYLDGSAMVLPGGRYSCAQELLARQLPFLLGRSLGQVCHIVQLAISKKKLLGYSNGAVVPYRHSQSMVKEKCAEVGRPCSNTGSVSGAARVATWNNVRTSMKDILDTMPEGSEFVPLSNLKRVFRSRFNLELSETSLGYPKLSELLQDSRLGEICTVRLQGHGYVVVPLNKTSKDRPAISLAAGIRSAGQEPLLPLPPALPALPAAAPAASARRARPQLELSLEEEATATVGGALAGGLVAYPTTPSPFNSGRARSLPKLLGSVFNQSLSKDFLHCEKDAMKTWASAAMQLPHTAAPYLDQASTSAAGGLPWGGFKPLTPSTLGLFMIQNTFIHANLPPPTPVGNLRAMNHRARSLPRNMGSDQADCAFVASPR